MRILLACALGVTTGMMVEKMRQAAGPGDVIEAHSTNELQKIYKDFDCVILGPQVRLQLNAVRKMCAPDGIPVDCIDIVAYGRMDGAKVFAQAKKMVEEAKQ